MSILDELKDFLGESFTARDVTFKNKTRTFYFKELKAGEAEEFFGKIDKDAKKNKGLRDRLLAMVMCDSKGNGNWISEAEAHELPNEFANKLQDAALEVNGLNKAAQEEAKKE